MFPLGLLRLFSILDGLSYVVLLYFSYQRHINDVEGATKIPGMTHGIIFCFFAYFLCLSWDKYKWSLKRGGLVFICALIPFAPFFLEPSLKREQNSPS